MNDTSSPYDWLHAADPALVQLDEIPLLGYPPHFPWGEYSQRLGELFHIDSLKIEPSEFRWCTESQIYENLGDHLVPVNLAVSAFSGEVCWVMAKEDITNMMSIVLSKQSSPPLQEIHEEFQKGFYRFIAMEAINVLYQIDFDHTITPHILDKEEPLQGNALVLDVKITLFELTFWGRLLVSPEFRKSWKEHYSEKKISSASMESLSRNTPVNIHLVAGKTLLNLSEWKLVSAGDFLLLDRCTIDPNTMKGKVVITLKDGTAILEGKIQNGNLKILGIPQFQEEETPMAKYPEKKNESLEEEFSEEEEIEEEESEEEPEEEETEEETEEEIEEEQEEEATKEDAEEAESKLAPFKEPPVSAQEIPITIAVEIGRLQMTMQKLLDLQPGNLLDLSIRPENGVNLVVNGKCVAKGELLRVGKTLGVRILDIG